MIVYKVIWWYCWRSLCFEKNKTKYERFNYEC